LIDIRLRSKISAEELEQKKGKILTHEDYNLLIHKDTTVRGLDGQVMAVFQKGVIPDDIVDKTYDTLHELKGYQTNNRGLASGTPRLIKAGKTRSATAKAISSAIVGSFDAYGPKQYCRLTAFSGREMDKYKKLFPLFVFIGDEMKKVAPARYNAQMEFINRTHQDWVIPNTPFTTVTVNNSYPTGVHTDKGDLDEGISTLACIKKGDIAGGYLVLPEYRIAFKMEHKDLLIFDAHQWHGNTELIKNSEDGERISVVCYYRTRMEDCDSMESEYLKRLKVQENKLVNE
tara:strand:+ start:8771 stop:9634 length:864 start_codon:yes stop_codon:yes gene_type:complete